jgi:hypothetical protein
VAAVIGTALAGGKGEVITMPLKIKVYSDYV